MSGLVFVVERMFLLSGIHAVLTVVNVMTCNIIDDILASMFMVVGNGSRLSSMAKYFINVFSLPYAVILHSVRTISLYVVSAHIMIADII